ncbi:MAG TPA: N-formylglutamate deformylase [Woeseiaceae bacterium]|jgi:N-formylglutamate amidohydrolase|nr:N-formylglutamate deformylase [Woeseiaceae bacterium]
MSDVFDWHEGDSPLLISIPHDGREIPPDIATGMTEAGLAIPDTDWHVRRLYAFAESIDASVIAANYSRYVVDLNRPPGGEALYEGQVSTGLCPLETFAGEPIYEDGYSPDADEIERRLGQYWNPYHRQLLRAIADIRTGYGYAVLWDAHSIRSEVPRLFSGTLPDLSLGTNDGASCPDEVLGKVLHAVSAMSNAAAANARFKGGYITRHYGRPEKREYAVQLEVAQRCYMDEATLRYDEARAGAFAEALETLLTIYRAAVTLYDTGKMREFLRKHARHPQRRKRRR